MSDQYILLCKDFHKFLSDPVVIHGVTLKELAARPKSDRDMQAVHDTTYQPLLQPDYPLVNKSGYYVDEEGTALVAYFGDGHTVGTQDGIPVRLFQNDYLCLY